MVHSIPVTRFVFVLSLTLGVLITLAACTPAQRAAVQKGAPMIDATASPVPPESGQRNQPVIENGVAKVSIAATDGAAWGYVPNLIEVPVGQAVSLTLSNHGVVDHDIEFTNMPVGTMEATEGAHGGTDAGHHTKSVVAAHARAGGTATVRFTPAEPGTYEFSCTLPGHKQAGMVGRMVVQASGLTHATTERSHKEDLSGDASTAHR